MKLHTSESAEIAISKADDLDGILELQEANQIANGGVLSGTFSRSQLLLMISTKQPLLVARYVNKVVGYLMSSFSEISNDNPIIKCISLDLI